MMMMMSGGHVLYFILLPVLAQVAADETDEQIMSEVMSGGDQERASSRTNPLLIRPPSHLPLQDSPLLPPSFLLQLLQNPDSPRSASASAPDSLSQSSQTSGELDESGEVTKRVFCNGFTGCGGRHRDRSRRQERYGKRLIPLLVKRPFCNSFGCYNGKRSSGLSLVNPADSYRARVLARMLAATRSASARLHQPQGAEERGMGAPGKRLFCNGYGGCRSGKRSLFSPWMSKMSGVVGGEGRR
ncbi:hypothetical protein ACOMHN_067360 [Nucella lapillus]